MTSATVARLLGIITLVIAAPALAQPAAAPAPDSPAPAEAPAPDSPAPAEAPPVSPERKADSDRLAAAKADGWPDLSAFLDEKYGFLPIAMPITEPAVGYGVAGGLAFLSKSLGQAAQGLGRPNITFVGGMGTANGSWGTFAGDSRYWLDDHVQTLTGFVYASINLDFHGIGQDSRLQDHPLRYNLTPKAGALVGKYRFGDSLVWGGLGYAFASTRVTFEAPEATPGIPDHDRVSNIGAALPSITLDTRDNLFTPVRGVFLDASVNVAAKWLGGDNNFERVRLTAIGYLPLPHRFYAGLRIEGAATFGDAPFYVEPYIGLRGVPIMRYQGEEVVTAEGELRWQFWGRWSILGFVGAGNAWNDFERLDNTQGVVSGGGGFRYELARAYGIHMGVDVAFSRDTTAFYLQVGSAWMRP